MLLVLDTNLYELIWSIYHMICMKRPLRTDDSYVVTDLGIVNSYTSQQCCIYYSIYVSSSKLLRSYGGTLTGSSQRYENIAKYSFSMYRFECSRQIKINISRVAWTQFWGTVTSGLDMIPCRTPCVLFIRVFWRLTTSICSISWADTSFASMPVIP